MKIEIEKLTVKRGASITALDAMEICFDSTICKSYTVLGANGAGKSTLLGAVLGIVPVFSGRILVDGITLEKSTVSSIRRKIGLVFQNSDEQLFSQTVYEDIAFGPRNLHLPEKEVRERVDEVMTALDLEHLKEREISWLSGGEKRRVALAGVLSMRPEAIFLDEPTSMLDPKTCREFTNYLERLNTMVVSATHDMAYTRKIGKVSIVLKNGKVAAIGETEEILANHELLLECGLE